jgi:superfamily I DNA/RNA helicase
MSVRVCFTREYHRALEALTKKGKVGRQARDEANAIAAEIAMQGEAPSHNPTKWGETRIPNCLKYDLRDYCRLVTQSVSVPQSGGKVQHFRVFLYVADKEDTERWLNNHRGYQWVRSDKDGTIDFVQITDPDLMPPLVPTFGTPVPDFLLDSPLLDAVPPEVWIEAGMPAALQTYLSSVTRSSYQQDPGGVVAKVEELSDTDAACFAIDVLDMALRGEIAAVLHRFRLRSGSAHVSDGQDLAAALVDPCNSETVITWDDSEPLPKFENWQDWMLFLRPIQAELARKTLNGPARIRGVSGSGKTTVIVHRARHLARTHKQRVMLVTLTESTRKLLDTLVAMLCGTESTLISTATVSKFILDSLEARCPQVLQKELSRIETGNQRYAVDDAVTAVRSSPDFSRSDLKSMADNELRRFLEEEIEFVRGRLCPADYDAYLTLARRGRGHQLHEAARRAVLAGVRAWDASLTSRRAADHPRIAQMTLLAMNGEDAQAPNEKGRYRCVLVDEVQDLSEIELRVLAKTMAPDGSAVVDLPDGLFLVGDGAQSIYNKSFSLSQCGININNRSWILKKNYRNTKQILEAAYGLIQNHEFSDADEEALARPQQPDFSSRNGERPWIVKCASFREEVRFVVSKIKELRQQNAEDDQANDFEFPRSYPICVIAFSKQERDACMAGLGQAQLQAVELREDVGWGTDAIKISTLESAKGHEFEAVFLLGLRDGVLPRNGEAMTKEVSRMYVAMTRARERLFLSYSIADGKRPSPFLNEIRPFTSEYQWTGTTVDPL